MSIHLPQLVYECDGCGACCSRSILECDHLDAMREPRIATEGKLLDGHGKFPIEDAGWSINDCSNGKSMACVFLDAQNRCGIYATRPNMCVSFQAGSEACQMRREWAKLPPLEPKVQSGVMAQLHTLFREGQDEDM